MSLTKAIRFRSLLSQLTHEECVGFLSKLVDSHMDTLVTSLFHVIKTNQSAPVNSFNKSLCEIIESREEKTQAVSTRREAGSSIEEFPICIIGAIASCLTQRDYFHFSSSSRSIYLGCNSPNLLQELSFHDNATKPQNLQLFPSVKKLTIDPSDVTKLSRHSNFDSPIFNQVTTLTLNGHYQADGWIQQFVDQNIVDGNTVTKLICMRFGDPSNDIETEGKELLSLFAQFPNLQHIFINQICATNDFTAQQILSVCPDVVGLGVVSGHYHGNDNQLNTNLITLLASKLKRLSFAQAVPNEFNFNHVTLGKLETLNMDTPDSQTLQSILKSASNMKKIRLVTERLGYSDGLMSNDEIKNAMENIFVKCPHLTYLCVEIDPSQFCSVLEGIECGLFETKQLQRTQLKIHIIFLEWNSGHSTAKANTFALNVGRIVNSLESSAIDDFMFIWNLSQLDDVDDDLSKRIFSRLCNISVHTKVFQHKHIFGITNPHCKINGYPDLSLW
eukprot:967972_1